MPVRFPKLKKKRKTYLDSMNELSNRAEANWKKSVNRADKQAVKNEEKASEYEERYNM